MWLLRAPEGIDGNCYGLKHADGVVTVTKQYWYSFLRERGYKEIGRIKGEQRSPRSCLVVGFGGIGDTLIMTPALRGYHEKYPDCVIDIMANAKADEILQANPFIRQRLLVLPHHIGHFVDNYDDAYDFSGFISMNPFSQVKNVYEIACELMGVAYDDKEKYRPDVYIDELLSKSVRRVLGVKEYIAVQVTASDEIRTYPARLQGEMISLLHKKSGLPIVLLGDSKIDVQTDGNEGLISILGQTTISEMVAVIKHAKLVVTPDSAAAHIAAATRTATLVIAASHNPETRYGLFDNINWIVGKRSCAPCFLHHTPCPLGEKEIPCLAGIKPSAIVEAALAVLSGQSIRKGFRRLQIKKTKCDICGSWNAEFVARKASHMFYRCIDCGTFYVRGKLNIKLYQKAKLDRFSTPRYINTQRYIAQMLCEHLGRTGASLEVGSNIGSLSNALKEKGWKTTVNDISENALEKSNADCKISGEFMTTNFNGKRYDLVIAHHIIEHFQDCFGFLRKCVSLLKKGGIISLMAPDSFGESATMAYKSSKLNPLFAGEHRIIISKAGREILYKAVGVKVRETFLLRDAFWELLERVDD